MYLLVQSKLVRFDSQRLQKIVIIMHNFLHQILHPHSLSPPPPPPLPTPFLLPFLFLSFTPFPYFCSPLPLFFLLQVAGEDSDEEDEQYTAADTYTNYKPAKCKNLHSSLLFSEMVIVMGKECIVLVWCIYCS